MINCEGSSLEPHRAFYFKQPVYPGCYPFIEGFTIKNGYGQYNESDSLSYGGAVLCESGMFPVFGNCLFYNNYADFGSCAYYDSLTGPSFHFSTFVKNSSDSGSGVVNFPSQLYGYTIASFSGCIFSYNEGKAITLRDQDSLNFPYMFYLCNIYGNTEGDYVGIISDLQFIENNISLNPFFCDTADDNYHLVKGSPCIYENPYEQYTIGALGADSNCTNTEPGSDVVLDVSAEMTITFDSVDASGVTTITFDSTGPEGIPAGYTFIPQNPPVYYDITTDVDYEGEVEICLHYNDSDVVGFGK